MSKVSITRSKLDNLAVAVSAKSGATLPLTIAQMQSAVESISPQATLQSKTVSYTPTTSQQTETVQADNGYDGLSSVSVTVNAMPSGSATVPSAISGTSASVAVGTNTLTFSKSIALTPNVTAGYIASGTSGNSTVTLEAAVPTRAAQTIYPSSIDYVMSSGGYLSGSQTFKAVKISSTLIASNIKEGVVVKIGDAEIEGRLLSITGTAPSGSTTINTWGA